MYGSHKIGNYNIFVSNPDILGYTYKDKNNYYNVLVHRVEANTNAEIYVNLLKSDLFKDIFNVDKNYRPTSSTDMVEYNFYLDNKDQQMPLWKLSEVSLAALFAKCQASV